MSKIHQNANNGVCNNKRTIKQIKQRFATKESKIIRKKMENLKNMKKQTSDPDEKAKIQDKIYLLGQQVSQIESQNRSRIIKEKRSQSAETECGWDYHIEEYGFPECGR
jgi:predicted metal-dependent hydrolase